MLPRDVLHTQSFVLLRIQEPKTRLRMARHQAARVEPRDLVELIDAVGDLHPAERLWLRSQTLRKRLDSLTRCSCDWELWPREGEKALDLGSIRPGGGPRTYFSKLRTRS